MIGILYNTMAKNYGQKLWPKTIQLKQTVKFNSLEVKIIFKKISMEITKRLALKFPKEM